MYIDGKLAARARLSVAAGLTFSLGSYDDGSAGEPNGGFNVGGYFENGLVKRGCTGALDNLMVFDGALSEEEINELCYTVKVDKEYDPDVVDTIEPSEEETPPTPAPTATNAPDTDKTPSVTEPDKTEEGSGNPTVIIVIVVVVVLLAAGVAVVLAKKKKDK